MINFVTKYPDTDLNTVCIPVDFTIPEVAEYLQTLKENIVDTILSNFALGLAAPQIGVKLRVFGVINDPELSKFPTKDDVTIYVNPEVLVRSLNTENALEGCLSFPGVSLLVERPASVTIKYLDLEGNEQIETAFGLKARAILHEYDHCDGVLFVDRVSSLKKRFALKELKNFDKKKGRKTMAALRAAYNKLNAAEQR